MRVTRRERGSSGRDKRQRLGRLAGLVALLTALLLVLAACAPGNGGDDEADEGDTTETEEEAPEDEEAPDLSGQTFTVASRWTGVEQENFQLVLDAFEEATGATGEYAATGDDAAAYLRTQLEGGSPPDVGIISNPALMGDLAAEGTLQPIEDVVGEEIDANFAEDWRELGSVDGELYGVWYKGANKSTFWYNTEVFETAGVEPPESWDDLLSAADSLDASGTPPFAIDGATGWVLTDWFENVYIRTAGADAYDQLTNHEIPWTDETVTVALERMAEIFSEDAWLAGGLGETQQREFPASITQTTFADQPGAAMVYEGDFVAGFIAGETNVVVGEGADFFNFPSIDGSAPAVVGGGDVAMLMTDNEAAAEFVRFMATPEAAVPWVEQGGLLSPNQNVDLASYPDDVSRRAAEGIVEAETFRFDMSDLAPPAFGGTPGAGMWGVLQDFLANPSDVQGAQEALEQEAAAAYG